MRASRIARDALAADHDRRGLSAGVAVAPGAGVAMENFEAHLIRGGSGAARKLYHHARGFAPGRDAIEPEASLRPGPLIFRRSPGASDRCAHRGNGLGIIA